MNQLIKQTLDPIGIPVSFGTFAGTANEYIIFNVWSIPGLHADDGEMQTNYTVQIDIFSTGNFLKIADEVKTRMVDAGFMRILDDPVEYIDEIKMFRKLFRFSYTKN